MKRKMVKLEDKSQPIAMKGNLEMIVQRQNT